MFFGKSFDQSRPWGPIFRFKSDPEYAHQVFWQFALEYFGNSRVSSQLFASYKECLCNYYRSRQINTEHSSVRKRDLPTFNCDVARKFQSCFDNICRHSYFNCFSDFNDYLMPFNCFSDFNDYLTPILSTADFLNFLNASKNIFPEQRAFLSSHRNINHDRDGNALTQFKEQQVSTAMYGWVTRDTMSHATSFMGTTVSRVFHGKFYMSLMVDIIETVIKLLSREISCLMVLDNFQCSNQLRDQRGGSSNKFLIGTSEAAHRVIPFLNFSWDDRKIELSYTGDQIVPSPLGMRSYEVILISSPSFGTDIFLNHEQIPFSDQPYFTSFTCCGVSYRHSGTTEYPIYSGQYATWV
jgi:hypothetical protein